MVTLFRVDQCLNGHYLNTVYGNVLQHVHCDGFNYYRLAVDKVTVATFSCDAGQGYQYSMCKVAADYTNGLTTVQHWRWNAVEKRL